MNKRLRFTIVTFSLLALLLAIFPASAQAEKTIVTGTFYFVGEPGEDPRVRGWTEGNVDHSRYDLQEYYFETDDPRLNGGSIALANNEFHYLPDGSFLFAHIWGTATIYADDAMTVPSWECIHNGWFNSQWVEVVDVNCHGLGENEGLKAMFTVTFPDENWNWHLSGEILEPGGE